MAAIGQALANLADPAARQRVLHWAGERFGSDTTPVLSGAVTESAAAVSPADDPALAVDSLNEMFAAEAVDLDDDLGEFGGPQRVEIPAAAPVALSLPLESVIRSFAADFRAFAEEWNGAAA